MSILLTLLSGGLTGILGNLVTQFIGYFQKRQEQKHQIALMNAQTDNLIRQTEAKVKGAIDLEEMKAFSESIKAASKQPNLLPPSALDKLLQHWWGIIPGIIISILFGVVDILKGFMRPGITLYLATMSGYITIAAYGIVREAALTSGLPLDPIEALGLLEIIVHTVLYMTSTIFGWWFGDRRSAKFMKQLMESKGMVINGKSK